jgi:hypothetical protein
VVKAADGTILARHYCHYESKAVYKVLDTAFVCIAAQEDEKELEEPLY